MNKKAEKKSQIKELLKIHWGYDDFRTGQEEVIDNILTKKSTVVIMPTGGGKSLCFQLPALVLEGVTIVVSPLIALMKDQVDSLEKIGIPATFINSSLSQQEVYNRLAEVQAGVFKLLYIAPERFYNKEFLSLLETVEVSLFAIDEAHCISEWGHDFRPSYLKLKDTVKLLGKPTIVALTATATPEVREDIINQLDLGKPEVVVTGFSRPNLQFGVQQAKEYEKPGIVKEAVLSMEEGSGIIYAGTRARVDEVTQFLLQNDIEAVAYHAGMEAQDRKWVQDQFIQNKTKLIVATNAFGLGIDKPDIRYVIHYDMPGTVEAYYQEAGRAGRDQKQSLCLLLYNSRDRALHEFFIKGDNPPIRVIRELHELLLSYETDSVLVTYSELSDNLSDTVPDMSIGTSLKILESTGSIMRSREKSGSAFVKSKTESIDEWREALGTRAKKSLEIVEALEKRFGKEMMEGLDLNFDEVADILQIKKDSLRRVIKKLADKEMLEYRPPFKGTEIRILKRQEFDDLKINREALKKKLRQAYSKLEKIEDYVFDLGCRQKYILDYFGDRRSDHCGQCDYCLQKKQSEEIMKEREEEEKVIEIVDSFLPDIDELGKK